MAVHLIDSPIFHDYLYFFFEWLFKMLIQRCYVRSVSDIWRSQGWMYIVVLSPHTGPREINADLTAMAKYTFLVQVLSFESHSDT